MFHVGDATSPLLATGVMLYPEKRDWPLAEFRSENLRQPVGVGNMVHFVVADGTPEVLCNLV